MSDRYALDRARAVNADDAAQDSAPSSCSLSPSQVGLSLNTQPLDNEQGPDDLAGESLLSLILCAIGNAGKRRKR